jgi:hypothetical protein
VSTAEVWHVAHQLSMRVLRTRHGVLQVLRQVLPLPFLRVGHLLAVEHGGGGDSGSPGTAPDTAADPEAAGRQAAWQQPLDERCALLALCFRPCFTMPDASDRRVYCVTGCFRDVCTGGTAPGSCWTQTPFGLRRTHSTKQQVGQQSRVSALQTSQCSQRPNSRACVQGASTSRLIDGWMPTVATPCRLGGGGGVLHTAGRCAVRQGGGRPQPAGGPRPVAAAVQPPAGVPNISSFPLLGFPARIDYRHAICAACWSALRRSRLAMRNLGAPVGIFGVVCVTFAISTASSSWCCRWMYSMRAGLMWCCQHTDIGAHYASGAVLCGGK